MVHAEPARRGGRHLGTGRLLSFNAGDGRLATIDVRDVAAFAARVLTSGRQHHDGRTFTLAGPESISFADVARRLTRVLGTQVDHLPVADEAQRTRLLARGVPAWIADMLVEYVHAYSTGWGDATSSGFRGVVGHSPRAVDDFLRDHAAAFS